MVYLLVVLSTNYLWRDGYKSSDIVAAARVGVAERTRAVI
jgi:hypothetical protein